jgi:putative two-component system response regulator
MKNPKHKILIVEDQAPNRKLLVDLCEGWGYKTFEATNGQEAIEKTLRYMPDLIIMDVMMPKMNGLQAMERLKEGELTKNIPIIIVTAANSRENRITGISKGASDFLSKPYDIEELILRIKNNLTAKKYHDLLARHNIILEEQVSQRTKELKGALEKLKESHTKVKSAYIETIYRLTLAAEYRDGALGEHIKRISLYTRTLAENLRMDSEYVECIYYASPMHDIGKVSIPDAILLKPGSLTPTEWEIMKTHTLTGSKILEGSESPLLKVGSQIALSHHERWDGSGYPYGLKGEDIPISARITIIADQYDALRSKRPYKQPINHEKTFRIITEGDGRTIPSHFDPEVLETFKRIHKDFEDIYETHKD